MALDSPIYKEIRRCLICGNDRLIPVLDLGRQALTGFFPEHKSTKVGEGPLQLVKCDESRNKHNCGLLQLRHAYRSDALYSHTYGYRSGLNQSMVGHLQDIVRQILRKIRLKDSDLVIDIGSNDGTLLKAYPAAGLLLAGIDPLGEKMRRYYPARIRLITDYFSRGCVEKNFGKKKAKVITSIAMFYDLKAPLDFMREVSDVLADDGIWVFEQSYMPAMLEMNSYDTVCHEHLEYYRLKQIKWMADRAGLKIIGVDFNAVNGGSFRITAAKVKSPCREQHELVRKILAAEKDKGLDTLKPYSLFRGRVFRHRENLRGRLAKIKSRGLKLLGYGASTKGNVILQFCGLSARDIPCIAEVNPDKFHSFTPGTSIPIISEKEARAQKPDYFLVLPWHFKENIIAREKEFLLSGGKLLFPLPRPGVTP